MANESTTWRRVPIIKLCAEHVDCVNRTAPVVSEPTPFKMIRTTNVRDGFIDTENVKYVTEPIYKKWTRRLVPKRGDVILTREAPLGGVGKLRTDDLIFLGQRLYHFRPDPEKLDADFLLYALMAPDLQGQIRGLGSGSTVEHMRLGDIPTLQIFAPAVSIQRRIASILSAYDDLIENNQRRIRILEEMARNLYREWFVKFRFPGHEKAKLVDSPLGKIPEGWKVKTVPEAIEIDPRLSVERGMPSPYVNMGDLCTDSMLVRISERRESGSGSRFQNGDTLFARITPCLENGKTGFVQCLSTTDTVAIGSTEFIVFRSRTLIPVFVYLLARSDSFRGNAIKSMTGASGRQRVQNACFDKYLLAHPPTELLQDFDRFVTPMLRLVQRLADRNANLRQTRDLLLPKLVSGEVDVSGMESDTLREMA